MSLNGILYQEKKGRNWINEVNEFTLIISPETQLLIKNDLFQFCIFHSQNLLNVTKEINSVLRCFCLFFVWICN